MQNSVVPHDEQEEAADEAEIFSERQDDASAVASTSDPDPLEMLLYDEVIICPSYSLKQLIQACLTPLSVSKVRATNLCPHSESSRRYSYAFVGQSNVFSRRISGWLLLDPILKIEELEIVPVQCLSHLSMSGMWLLLCYPF